MSNEEMKEKAPCLPNTRNEKRTRLSNLDSLRIFAALGVCLFHLNWDDDSVISRMCALGYLGVNIFFCISGYLTPKVLDWSRYRISKFGLFMMSRFFRIYPVFAIVVLFEIYLNSFGNSWLGYGIHIEDVTWIRTIANFTLTADFIGQRWYLPIFWTLGVEVQFAIAMGLTFPLLKSKYQVLRIATFLAWALAPMCILKGPSIMSYSALFAMGIAVYMKEAKLISIWLFGPLLGIAFYGHYHAISSYSAYTALGASLIIAFVPQFHARWIEYWGKRSYSFFLIHVTFGGAVLIHLSFLPEMWYYQIPAVLLATAVSAGFATIYYRYCELPFHTYSRNLKLKSNSGPFFRKMSRKRDTKKGCL